IYRNFFNFTIGFIKKIIKHYGIVQLHNGFSQIVFMSHTLKYVRALKCTSSFAFISHLNVPIIEL
uniref:Uncharacterized protein n=1 Tax=Amphimedon queenslandica TaxID=400682 RepID=A0A1X7TQS8_AMPQE